MKKIGHLLDEMLKVNSNYFSRCNYRSVYVIASSSLNPPPLPWGEEMHLGAKVLCIFTTISIGVRYFDKLDFPLACVFLHFRYTSLETAVLRTSITKFSINLLASLETPPTSHPHPLLNFKIKINFVCFDHTLSFGMFEVNEENLNSTICLPHRYSWGIRCVLVSNAKMPICHSRSML